MPGRNRFGHLFLVAWLLVQPPAHSEPLPNETLRVAVTEDGIAMAVDQRSRREAIEALANALRLDLTVAGLDDQVISVQFAGLSPDRALGRILGPLSFTLFVDIEAKEGWLAIHGSTDESKSVFRTVPDSINPLEQVSALAEANGAPNIDAVHPFLDAGDWAVRAEAAHALGEIESADATVLLGTLLRDSHPAVREAAVDALMSQGHDHAADLLGHALDGAGEQLQLAILDALIEMGTETSKAHLLRTAQSAVSDAVRETAHEALLAPAGQASPSPDSERPTPL